MQKLQRSCPSHCCKLLHLVVRVPTKFYRDCLSLSQHKSHNNLVRKRQAYASMHVVSRSCALCLQWLIRLVPFPIPEYCIVLIAQHVACSSACCSCVFSSVAIITYVPSHYAHTIILPLLGKAEVLVYEPLAVDAAVPVCTIGRFMLTASGFKVCCLLCVCPVLYPACCQNMASSASSSVGTIEEYRGGNKWEGLVPADEPPRVWDEGFRSFLVK